MLQLRKAQSLSSYIERLQSISRKQTVESVKGFKGEIIKKDKATGELVTSDAKNHFEIAYYRDDKLIGEALTVPVGTGTKRTPATATEFFYSHGEEGPTEFIEAFLKINIPI